MDDDHNISKTRKGKNGLKNDQHMKAQNDSIFGSKKHVRLKEKMMEQTIGTKSNIKSSIDSKFKSKKKKKKQS
jgi:hypothetical protein